MMSELYDRGAQRPNGGKPVKVQRESKPKADESLIEEILKSAGLEPLD